METGLDRLAAEDGLQKKVKGRAVGLLAHGASVTRELVHAADVLLALGARLPILFGPEHGYDGAAQDMVGVADWPEAAGRPIRSLYGTGVEDLSPKAEDLEGLDLVVMDLQDVGARYYTFVWTALLVLRACAKAHVPVLVLDRPNPLGGAEESLEGRCQQPSLCSFVGLVPVAVRHGLTLGEMLAWRAHVEGMAPEVLDVVTVGGARRDDHAPQWDRPFVLPSPNMPTYETALVYPGGCLVEGTNLSEGRGTTRPFELVGAPWLDGRTLAKELAAASLPGVAFRPVTFRPTFHKHQGAVCGGVQVHVTAPAAFRPYATYLALLSAAHRLAPADFAFRTERYEFRDDVPALDLLTGSDVARRSILQQRELSELLVELSGAGPDEREIYWAARRAVESLAL